MAHLGSDVFSLPADFPTDLLPEIGLCEVQILCSSAWSFSRSSGESDTITRLKAARGSYVLSNWSVPHRSPPSFCRVITSMLLMNLWWVRHDFSLIKSNPHVCWLQATSTRFFKKPVELVSHHLCYGKSK